MSYCHKTWRGLYAMRRLNHARTVGLGVRADTVKGLGASFFAENICSNEMIFKIMHYPSTVRILNPCSGRHQGGEGACESAEVCRCYWPCPPAAAEAAEIGVEPPQIGGEPPEMGG
ncbi:hypothetical protein Nepgr_023625 [Nepenthes gracilis]|uniref:Uncharacterized protein n=1 Tax=Nepenthes gracilis TaxID=150966 RepID=A0AAD3T193_NEPGR|nr:hypothetical protein Nepgr_023625 [Nepenthes gracilis]